MTDPADALRAAIWNMDLPGVEDVLRESPEAATRPSEVGGYPLAMAAQSGNVDIVKLLLASGADVNAASQQGQTALHAAAQAGHGAIVDLLLAAGADLELDNEAGRTPLGDAVHRGAAREHAVVRRLIEAGADVQAGVFMPVLLEAVAGGDEEIVRLILAAGAEVNVVTPFGTPLTRAVEFDRPRVAEVLLAFGADKELRTPPDYDGHPEFAELTALEIAKRRHRRRLIAVLDPNSEEAQALVEMAPADLLARRWRGVLSILRIKAPDVLASLQEAVSPERLQEVQELLGGLFPSEVRTLYELSDGQAGEGRPLIREQSRQGPQFRLLSLAEATDRYPAMPQGAWPIAAGPSGTIVALMNQAEADDAVPVALVPEHGSERSATGEILQTRAPIPIATGLAEWMRVIFRGWWMPEID